MEKSQTYTIPVTKQMRRVSKTLYNTEDLIGGYIKAFAYETANNVLRVFVLKDENDSGEVTGDDELKIIEVKYSGNLLHDYNCEATYFNNRFLSFYEKLEDEENLSDKTNEEKSIFLSNRGDLYALKIVGYYLAKTFYECKEEYTFFESLVSEDEIHLVKVKDKINESLDAVDFRILTSSTYSWKTYSDEDESVATFLNIKGGIVYAPTSSPDTKIRLMLVGRIPYIHMSDVAERYVEYTVYDYETGDLLEEGKAIKGKSPSYEFYKQLIENIIAYKNLIYF